MNDQTPPTTDTSTDNVIEAEVVVEQNFAQKFANKHPRATKYIAIVGGVLVAGSTLTLANTVRKNSTHVDAAKDHLLEAGRELSDAVSPTSETTDA